MIATGRNQWLRTLGIKGEMPMSAMSMIGGLLLVNAVVFAALMLRRDQPALRDRLFLWVIDGRREAEEGPANPTDSQSIPAVPDSN